MNVKLTSLLAAALVGTTMMIGSAPAAAQSFTAAGPGTTCDPQKISNTPSYTSATAFGSVACTSAGVTATLTAWGYMHTNDMSTASTTTAYSGFVQGNLGDFNSNGIGAYTGTKEASANYGEHAFDNVATSCSASTDASNYSGGTTLGGGTAAVGVSSANGGCGGAIEAMLLSFSQAVKMTSVATGYVGDDADLSVYIWTGGGSGPNMTTQTLANDATNGLAGWKLVGSSDLGGQVATGGSSPYNIAAGGNADLYSSYFLITTYFGATNGGLEYGNDEFKISGFTASTCTQTLSGGTNTGQTCGPSGGGSTPEPSSLALLGLAALGAGVMRRRSLALQAA